ncbi:hypothetical protein SDC9_67114 [bioreactor metagenome]|uniref:DUF1697 domain-containing protein n=1 Tax=bioreactor metagenome TaxID=1076179 RepID=A0A644XY13_9ZZZZ
MEKYIALLRGVNVGGKNQISMPELKKFFENSGFMDVTTYINSGNIIFSAGKEDTLSLQLKIHQLISDTFRLDIAVAVISAVELREALVHAPLWWGEDIDARHNAIFVISPANPSEIIESVGQLKPEYEQVAMYGNVIFWSAPLATFSRTRFSKVVSTPSYGSVTIRNANTAKKLEQLSR